MSIANRKINIGRMWITKDEETKFIKKDEWTKFEQQGWRKGTHKRSSLRKSIANSGRIAITNGFKTKHIKLVQLTEYKSKGWRKGRDFEFCKKLSKGHMGELNGMHRKNITKRLLKG